METGGTISQYLVETLHGRRFANSFAQIATSSSTAFSNSGLLANTSL